MNKKLLIIFLTFGLFALQLQASGLATSIEAGIELSLGQKFASLFPPHILPAISAALLIEGLICLPTQLIQINNFELPKFIKKQLHKDSKVIVKPIAKYFTAALSLFGIPLATYLGATSTWECLNEENIKNIFTGKSFSKGSFWSGLGLLSIYGAIRYNQLIKNNKNKKTTIYFKQK